MYPPSKAGLYNICSNSEAPSIKNSINSMLPPLSVALFATCAEKEVLEEKFNAAPYKPSFQTRQCI